MTTSTIAAPPPSRPARERRRAPRVLALVLGTLLLLPGLGLVLGGGILLWASGMQRVDGFVVSPEDRFSTSAHALVSERIDLHTGADWLPIDAALGDARVQVTPRGNDPVFVGIARAADAQAYLSGVGRTEIEALGFDSPAGSDDQRPGTAPAGPPADQGFWIAQASGPGMQQVTWPAAEGDWMFVIMRPDGSAGIDVRARIGAEFPALGTVGWTVLVVGVGLTALIVPLIAPGARRRS
jgi:hypothetical protein